MVIDCKATINRCRGGDGSGAAAISDWQSRRGGPEAGAVPSLAVIQYISIPRTTAQENWAREPVRSTTRQMALD